MKNKKSPVGQYIFDGMGDTEEAYEYVQDFLPLIGKVILFFNSLESELDHIICQIICDRADTMGLQVLHNMSYAKKVDLYDRFTREAIRAHAWDDNIEAFGDIISKLERCGTNRNQVVHANWQSTNNDGYTHVKFTKGSQGLEHQFVQYTVESLEKIIKEIIEVSSAIQAFEDEFDNWKCYGARS